MSQDNYILVLLNIEDKNIKLLRLLYHMNLYIVIDVVAFLTKNKLMKRKDIYVIVVIKSSLLELN